MRQRGEHPYSTRDLSRIEGDVPAYVQQIAHEQVVLQQPIWELVENFELNESELERQTVQSFNRGYEQLIKGTGLESFVMPQKYVHIIHEGVLQDYLVSHSSISHGENIRGFVHDGHIYLPHTLDHEKFLTVYSHEFMHAASQYKKRVGIRENKDYNQIGEPSYQSFFATLRSGVHQISERDGVSVQFGVGFNEALTEMCALELRKVTRYPTPKMSQKKQEWLKNNYTTYPFIIDAVSSVLRKYIPEVPLKDILVMYISGIPDVLQLLSKRMKEGGKKDGLKQLFSMGVDQESAEGVKKYFGITI